jgi:hypothetical protein
LLGLLPLLTAGFIFNVLFYRTRFEVTPAEGQRLFFMSATAGLLLGVVAYPLSAMLPQRWLHAGANIYHVKEAAPLLFAMLLAPVLALVGNALYWFWKTVSVDAQGSTWEWQYRRLIKKYGNPQQQLLLRAMEADSPKLVLLSLSSRKIYCGIIRRMPALFSDKDRHIEIIPKFSAYRDKDTLVMKERVDYYAFDVWLAKQRLDVLKRYQCKERADQERNGVNAPASNPAVQKELEDIEALLLEADARSPGFIDALNIEDWTKVIAIDQIEVASIYDESAFQAWFKPISAA